MTMAEMYSKTHAVSYKLYIIKQTVDTINCKDFMLRLNFVIAIRLFKLHNGSKVKHQCQSDKKLQTA